MKDNGKDPQDIWHPPGEPWRDCILYEPGTMSVRQQCRGLKQLYCEKEGKCGFYKPRVKAGGDV